MKQWKIIAAVIVVIAIAALVWTVLQTRAPFSVSDANNATSTGAAAASSSAAAGGSASEGGGSVTQTGAGGTANNGGSIYITSPSAGAHWVYKETNTISWSRAAGASNGSIYIVNAQNGAVVGWILGTVIPTQSSFSWNTRDVYASRTSANKKDITPGQYVVKVQFDSPGEPTIWSAPFFIVTASSSAPPSYSFYIKNAAIVPATITVPHGDQLIFVNADNATYQIQISNGSSFTIPNLGYYTVSTDNFAPGEYIFSSGQYPNLKTTVTVQ